MPLSRHGTDLTDGAWKECKQDVRQQTNATDLNLLVRFLIMGILTAMKMVYWLKKCKQESNPKVADGIQPESHYSTMQVV